MPLKVVFLELAGVTLDEWSGYAALDAAMLALTRRFSLTEEAQELSGEFSLRLMDLVAAEGPPSAPGEAEGPPAEFQPFEVAAKEILVEMLDARGFHADPADRAWFWDALVAEHRRNAKPYPEVPKALRALQEEDLRLSVLTDMDPVLAEAVLDGSDLMGFFDHVVTAKLAGYVKPSVKLFERGLACHRGVLPGEALMVGASYERDVLGARRAGLRAVLVDRHDARLVGKDEKVTNLRKVLPVARGLLG